jgi:glycosyltransferase involved in cell wall biosynthesis
VHRRSGLVLYPPRLTSQVQTTGVRRDLKRLVFCGRLEQVKGAADAIEIMKLLPSDYHLEVLGDGVEQQRLRDQVRRCRLDGRVNFHGWVDAAARDAWVRSAGVVLVPSLWDEAFGMVGPEAFAMETPVVAYDVGGIPEWCGSGAGIRVACGDFSEAAAAVLQLTQDSGTWSVCSAAAKRIADEQFPPSRFGEELDAILNHVFSVAPSSPGTKRSGSRDAGAPAA